MQKVTLDTEQFGTDQIIIVVYKGGSAGKFLINCLGLASNAVLQDRTLADQQCDGTLTQQDKLWELLTRISDTSGKWNDLGFDSYQFFGQPFVRYLETYPDMAKYWLFNNAVARTIDQGNKFFIESHSLNCANAYLKVWPNARIIYFENADNFLEKTEPSYLDGSLEYRTVFNRLETRQAAKMNLITWDPNWYLESELFYTKLEELYQQLNLCNFNLDLIKQLYTAWAAKRLL